MGEARVPWARVAVGGSVVVAGRKAVLLEEGTRTGGIREEETGKAPGRGELLGSRKPAVDTSQIFTIILTDRHTRRDSDWGKRCNKPYVCNTQR